MCDKYCSLQEYFYEWSIIGFDGFGPHRVLLSWATETSRFGGMCNGNGRLTRVLSAVFAIFPV